MFIRATRRFGEGAEVLLAGMGIIVLFVLIAGFAWGCPQYSVYQQEMSGKAKLKEAESSKMIMIEDAKARRESAKMLAEAEVERAKGVSEANKIIGSSLRDNEAYLMYMWIHELSSNNNDIIYIPTEAGLPILEAGRFKKPVAAKEDKKEEKK